LELIRLSLEHESAVFDFEVTNREHFASSISDRGDDFFDSFTVHFRELLAEQDTGQFAYHVLVEDDYSIVGRFNLYDIEGGSADVGYRVALAASGRGVATAGLRDLCRIARDPLGLTKLSAGVNLENVASRHVLEKVGFRVVGPALVGGRDGTRYERDLADPH
jgi:ribosomal-protein-alanine N-acetyltransferase